MPEENRFERFAVHPRWIQDIGRAGSVDPAIFRLEGRFSCQKFDLQSSDAKMPRRSVARMQRIPQNKGWSRLRSLIGEDRLVSSQDDRGSRGLAPPINVKLTINLTNG
jgi:hypothetical protein